MNPRIMIVTGEASGDLHGAHLLKSLQNRLPGVQAFGMGGPELALAGMEIVFDGAKVAVVGLTEVISHLPNILSAQRVLRRCLKQNPPDLLIIIDLPDFNIPLAKLARKRGIPVFYYIPPQIWAWRSGRIKTIKRVVDQLGVILPFEEQYYRQRGVAAKYVGHPLLDSVHLSPEKDKLKEKLGLTSDTMCIGLLPGSRKREVQVLLPHFLESGCEIAQKISDSRKIVFLIPKASTLSLEDLRSAGIEKYEKQIDIRIIEEQRWDVMANCDAAVVASGTVTLELAMLGVPMVVCYRLAPITYRLGRLLIHLEHFSLVNLIAGTGVVPELLQEQVSSESICQHLLPLLNRKSAERQQMESDLAGVRKALGEVGASDRTAQAVLEMLVAT